MIFKKKRKCEKLIKYQDYKIEFGTDIGSGVFSIDDFKFGKENLASASRIAQALDDYQYQNCLDNQHLKETDPEFQSYLENREKIRNLMLSFISALEAVKADSNQSDQVTNSLEDIRHFLEIKPSIEKEAKKLEGLGIRDEVQIGKDVKISEDPSKEIEDLKEHNDYFETRPIQTAANSSEYLKAAVAFYYKNEFQKSKKVIQDCLRFYPNNGLAWNMKGLIHLMNNEIEDAKNSFKTATKNAPTNAIIWFNEGILFSRINKLEKAIQCFDKVLELDPKNVDALINKGNAHLKTEDFKNAVSAYKKAINLDSKNDLAVSNLANVYSKLGDYDIALNYYKKSQSIRETPDTFTNMAFCCKRLNDMDGAENYVNLALHINPDYVPALYNKACYASILNKKEDALKFLQEAIILDSEYKQIALNDQDFKNFHNDNGFKQIID